VQALRSRVRPADQGKLHQGPGEITPEHVELSRLRAENARPKLEDGILRGATPHYAEGAL